MKIQEIRGLSNIYYNDLHGLYEYFDNSGNDRIPNIFYCDFNELDIGNCPLII